MIIGLIKDLAGLLNQSSLNTLTFQFTGSFYVKLPAELRSAKKGLSHIKNEDQKCFLWCYVRHINSVKIHPERIKKEGEILANYIDYDGIEFPVQEKDFNKIETRNNICINVLGYENGLTFPIHAWEEKFENFMDFLHAIDGNKSHYMYIKDFHRFMFHKMKSKTKKYFCKSCLW